MLVQASLLNLLNTASHPVLQACFGVGPRHRVGIRIKYAVQNSVRKTLFWTRVYGNICSHHRDWSAIYRLVFRRCRVQIVSRRASR